MKAGENMVQTDYFGVPIPTEAEMQTMKLKQQYEKDIETICKQLNIKTPKEIEREEWELEHEYDAETQTTKELRAKIVDGFCYNINHELVYIGDI